MVERRTLAPGSEKPPLPPSLHELGVVGVTVNRVCAANACQWYSMVSTGFDTIGGGPQVAAHIGGAGTLSFCSLQLSIEGHNHVGQDAPNLGYGNILPLMFRVWYIYFHHSLFGDTR